MFSRGIIIIIFILSCSGAKFPSTISRCQYEDSNCMTQVAQKVISEHYNGLPSLNLVPLDPVTIKTISIENSGNRAVNIRLVFNNVTLHGLKNIAIQRITGFSKQYEGSKNEIEFVAPIIQLVGQYQISGKVLILPIQGNGQSNFTLENVKIRVKFTGKKVTKNQNDYFQTNDIKISMTTSKLWIHFDNLYNGDKLLGDTTNTFLNENWMDIFNELKPDISKAYAAAIQTIINNVFAKLPYREYFVE
ncbi:protein takeout-like [Phlebotomus argentipes]|uniref:protein takeout-like n=1 Tax=Phlebotomus argentipes TaxID=94469 RepID=UPI002893568C|nr:protein takeout-like [Phlebotomus argentipes]